MADREKVIRELKAARLFFEMGSNRDDGAVGNLGCKSGMKYIEDALKLLKEQEAVEPTLKREAYNKYYNYYVCPRCNNDVDYEQNYCSECGVKFMWEGR